MGPGFWTWDIAADCLIDCSNSYARMMGMTREHLMMAYCSAEQDVRLVHPEDRQPYIEEDQESIRSGGIDVKYRIITPDGEVRHLHEVSEIIKNDEGHWHGDGFGS